jgi:two-component system, chemotaxis family, sensor kinase CheA
MFESDPSLINDFITEANEHLETMESTLLRLAADPTNRDLLNTVFRPVHTIKGASQFMGFTRIVALSHKLEDLLDLLRQGKKLSSPAIVETLIIGRDRIAMLVADLAGSQTEGTPVDDLIAHLEQIIQGDGPDGETMATVEKEMSIATETTAIDFMEESPSLAPPAEVYEEENDRELFAIFIDQLRENLTLLYNKTQQLTLTPNLFEELDHCLDRIKILNSSANYMGYQALSALYEQWCDEILATQQVVAMDQDFSLDFMTSYLAQVIQFFPQYGDQLLQEPELSESVSPTTEAVAPSDIEDSEPNEPADQQPLLPAEMMARPMLQGDPLESVPIAKLQPVATEPVGETALVQLEAGEQPKTESAPVVGERVFKKSVRVDAQKIDTLMNQVGELIVDRSYFFQLFNEMRNLQQHLKINANLDQKEMKLIRSFTYRLGEAIVSLSRTSNELQEGVMKVRMLPIAQLFNRYPRLIHDLTHGTSKQVQLEIRGEDTELDRMIIEEMSDPLIHIIRNAIDHGFETAAERKQLGKSPVGTLILEAYHESNHVVIEIVDDGRGMDPILIKAKTLERRLSSKEELDRMTPWELLRLVMLPGFSTAKEITNTSGRGVGMDVVKKNIEKLNGTIEIESMVGAQTCIRLKIPLTLAIISALMVRVGDNLFTIPLANVEETLRIFAKDITTMEGTEVIYLRGKTTPIFRLSTLFEMPSSQHDVNKFFVVIVNAGLRKIGLVVDELLGQEEVVIKPLVDYLQEKSGLSGATIIGDGRISLILDVYELANIAINRQVARSQDLANSRRKPSERQSG